MSLELFLYLGAKTLMLAAPLYITNGCALLFGGKTPMDLNTKFIDNKPLLGPGKTFKGSIRGILCGTIASAALFFALPILSTPEGFGANYILLGFLLSLGAVIGDILASFLKRRFDLERGKSVFLLDQLDFIVGGIALAAIIYVPSIVEIALLVVLTPTFHLLGNFIAFKTKKKQVPW
ncbi:MAG: CDP-2,3-bis-(O-geranylgeranyl)-sn-glycerol synthase [Candidatus Diapherotrites archaeon]|nr:CDP-2,3-bis-(O-geranylgeranyl)-sn-glycerol synthase [Candidatus Diapherotrites archaeon]